VSPPGREDADPSSAAAHRRDAPQRVPSVVLTVSDTRTLADDTGGALIVELLEAAGHPIVGRTLVPDDIDAIQQALDEAVMRDDVAAVRAGTRRLGGGGDGPLAHA
jgi:molybdenum cofactor biosynthesis protein B